MADYQKRGQTNPKLKSGVNWSQIQNSKAGATNPKIGPKMGGACLHSPFLILGPGKLTIGGIYPATY
jgi:hypothetical protein